jgi:hypothetical protein
VAKVRRTLFWIVVSAVVLFGAAGCTEEQLTGIDRAVADANRAVQVPAAFARAANEAAPGLIPPQVQSILELLGFAGVAGIAVWQKVRASGALAKVNTLTATGKAIVAAVENLPADPPDGMPSAQVLMKRAVGVEMMAAAAKSSNLTYKQMNAIVDELKAS